MDPDALFNYVPPWLRVLARIFLQFRCPAAGILSSTLTCIRAFPCPRRHGSWDCVFCLCSGSRSTKDNDFLDGEAGDSCGSKLSLA